MIWTAYNNYKLVGLTSADQACKIVLFYWDWVMDYDPNSYDEDYPMYRSAVWGDEMGTPPSDWIANYYDGAYVNGAFNKKAYNTTFPCSTDFNDPSSAFGDYYDNGLKRLYDGVDFPFQNGPTEMISAITTKPKFKEWSLYVEGGPHAAPHMTMYFNMGQMTSPDDPLFWLHHCCIDRLYKFWMDCNEYENIANTSLTTDHYEGKNPIDPYGNVAYNPYTGFAYSVTADSQIPFYYLSSGDSDIFVKKNLPTPRQVWGANPTTKGWQGMWAAYGFDALADKFGSACTKNKKWSLVHQTNTTKKRSDEEDRVYSHPSSQHFKSLGDKFQQEVAKGRPHAEVLKSMVMENCDSKPKIQLTDRFLKWIKMNNLGIATFDTPCDKVSERYEQQFGTNKVDQIQNPGETGVPLWVIITASVGTVLLLIAVITLIVLYIRKTSKSATDGAYVEMKE